MRPVNDGRSWDRSTDFFACLCGCGDFWIKRDAITGFNHVICRQCEADHSLLVTAPQ